MLRRNLATVVAGAMPPVGSPNTFVEISLVDTDGSIGFPDVELAPVSLIKMEWYHPPCPVLVWPLRGLSHIFCVFGVLFPRLEFVFDPGCFTSAPCFAICVSMCRWQAKSYCFLLFWFLLVWYGPGIQLGYAAGSNN